MRCLGTMLLALPVTAVFAAGPDAIPTFVDSPSRAVVSSWLARHSGFRVATDEDCQCVDDIAKMREGESIWVPEPDYHPYYVRGDFNGDGKSDLAVVILSERDERKLLIFNGPLAPGTAPAFQTNPGFGVLFYKRGRLLYGAFESEAAELRPRGRTYDIVDSGCC